MMYCLTFSNVMHKCFATTFATVIAVEIKFILSVLYECNYKCFIECFDNGCFSFNICLK